MPNANRDISGTIEDLLTGLDLYGCQLFVDFVRYDASIKTFCL